MKVRRRVSATGKFTLTANNKLVVESRFAGGEATAVVDKSGFGEIPIVTELYMHFDKDSQPYQYPIAVLSDSQDRLITSGIDISRTKLIELYKEHGDIVVKKRVSKNGLLKIARVNCYNFEKTLNGRLKNRIARCTVGENGVVTKIEIHLKDRKTPYVPELVLVTDRSGRNLHSAINLSQAQMLLLYQENGQRDIIVYKKIPSGGSFWFGHNHFYIPQWGKVKAKITVSGKGIAKDIERMIRKKVVRPNLTLIFNENAQLIFSCIHTKKTRLRDLSSEHGRLIVVRDADSKGILRLANQDIETGKPHAIAICEVNKRGKAVLVSSTEHKDGVSSADERYSALTRWFMLQSDEYLKKFDSTKGKKNNVFLREAFKNTRKAYGLLRSSELFADSLYDKVKTRLNDITVQLFPTQISRKFLGKVNEMEKSVLKLATEASVDPRAVLSSEKRLRSKLDLLRDEASSRGIYDAISESLDSIEADIDSLVQSTLHLVANDSDEEYFDEEHFNNEEDDEIANPKTSSAGIELSYEGGDLNILLQDNSLITLASNGKVKRFINYSKNPLRETLLQLLVHDNEELARRVRLALADDVSNVTSIISKQRVIIPALASAA